MQCSSPKSRRLHMISLSSIGCAFSTLHSDWNIVVAFYFCDDMREVVARGVCRTLIAVCIRQENGQVFRISCRFGGTLSSGRSARLCCYHGRPGRSECTSE